jgi:PAS domain S-box-containing protein
MKPARRSTAPPVLPLLALALGFAFSAWCVVLAVSMESLRSDVAENVSLLRGLETVRAGLLSLERVVMDRHEAAEPALPRWRDEYARVLVDFQSLGLGFEPSTEVHERLGALERALSALNDVAQPVLPAPPDQPGLRDLEDACHRANMEALDRTAAAIDTIRVDQAAVSSTLGRRWRSLFVLAVLSVATVIVLALLFRGARRDAEKHKKAKHSLRESEQRLESVLAAVPDLIIVLDAKGKYREVYTAEVGLLYRPPEELFGRTIHEVLPKEVAAPIQDIIDRTLAAGELQQHEYPLTIAEEVKWFSARVAPFGAPDDPCVLWVARDITARKLAEGSLRESEARFRQLAENIDEVVSMAPAGRRGVEYVSPAYETIFGRSCQRLYERPRSWLELIHPDDKQRVIESFEANAPRGCFDEEFRIVRDDGSIRWIRDRTFPIRDAWGDLYRIAGLSQDITDRKRADQELREREERFRSVVDTATDAVIVADNHSVITL